MPETGDYLPAVAGGIPVKRLYGQWFTASGMTAMHVPVWPVASVGGKKAEVVTIRASKSIDLVVHPDDLASYGARFGTNEVTIALNPTIMTLSFRGLEESGTAPVHFRWAVTR